MSSRRIRFVVLSASLLLLGISLILFSTSESDLDSQHAERASIAPTADSLLEASTNRPPLKIEAFEVAPVVAANRVEVAGLLEPEREVIIGAEVPGRVIEVEVEEHTRVDAGQRLVRLDPALPRAAVERARAALLRAKAGERLAASEVTRQRELASRGVASTAELDRAESQDKRADAEVEEARAALLDAETRLEKTEIRAPFAGVISALDLEPGAYLNPGEPVASLADISSVKIEVGLSDREILSIHDGDPVQVAIEALAPSWIEGNVVHPGRTLDNRTRKYPVAVRIPNPEETMLPGMLGSVRFEIGPQATALWIPRRSVFSEFDLDYVYLIDTEAGESDGRTSVQRRRIQTRTVPFRPEWLEVTEGLVSGQWIANSDFDALRDGRSVTTEERALGPFNEEIRDEIPSQAQRVEAQP